MTMYRSQVIDSQLLALSTRGTANGSVATFDTDMTENLVEVKCQIVAKQASGTPSPDNPLPITTYTEMNVSACGKNLWTFGDISGTQRKQVDIKFPFTGDYVLSGLWTSSDTDANVCLAIGVYSNGNVAFNQSFTRGTRQSLVLNLTDTLSYIMFYASDTNAHSVGDTFSITDIQLEKGTTPTAFTPYGTTANIPFGQTVANGVLDVTTGKLGVTYNFIQPTWGSFGNKVNLGSNTRGILNITSYGEGINNNPDDLCNKLPFDSTFSLDSPHFYVSVSSGTTLLVATLPNGTSNDEVLDVAYELATPIEIQLDSITLQALLNENNIWCDTGDTSVKYILSVGKAIS